MQEIFYQIIGLLDQMEALQDGHIQSFDADLLPDLETQMQERGTGFGDLIRAVDKFNGLAGESPDDDTLEMIRAIDRKIHRLLAQNRTLYQKAKAHRDGIHQSLMALNKGRKVIQAYRPPAYVTNRPRAINFTN